MSNTKKLVSFDWAIKRLLRNKASFGIFEGFLSELLREDIKIKSLLESESNRETKDDRSNRVDMLVENSKGELIIVEVQRETEYDYLQRILFGASKLLLEYMKKSMPYSTIKKVISISLVYFDLGVGEDYAYHGLTQFIGLNKKDILELNSVQQELYKKEKISDIYPEYYLLKINQFDDIARNTIDEWIYFFKNETIRDDFTAKGLKQAGEELDMMKMSEEERREYEAYQESLRYQASMFESSYKVGEKKGEKKGKFDMAKILKDNGVDIDIIIKSSGLSREEIEKL
jgi:predicted transposase/invertase (TIGR01784 family)